jgi:hypothetical protein
MTRPDGTFGPVSPTASFRLLDKDLDHYHFLESGVRSWTWWQAHRSHPSPWSE